MKACMVVTNGFEEVETVGTYAILRRGGVDVQIYSLKGDAAVGRFGLTCADLHSMDALHPQDFDALILPRSDRSARNVGRALTGSLYQRERGRRSKCDFSRCLPLCQGA